MVMAREPKEPIAADLDPELAPAVAGLHVRRIDWAHGAARIEEIRSAFGPETRSSAPLRRGVVFEDSVAELAGRAVPVRILRPAEPAVGPLPVLVWVHGGGYVMGSAFVADDRAERWVVHAGVAVVSVDYRLAPEHPYPAAVDDVWLALRWVAANAEALGFDRRRLGIAGASAGAGIAASAALRSRKAGGRLLAFQLLIYPMLDDSNVAPRRTDDPVWPVAANRFSWGAYLAGVPANRITEDAAAARADDLSGLPTTGVFLGALDLFRQEDIAFASRLMDAGVTTELHVYPAAPHGFDHIATAEVARRFAADLDEFVRRQVARDGETFDKQSKGRD